ncbi:hypothetical protein GCM10025868_24450 [Angustibacter aerolatus]|uniref:Uncharacterized protein n=1 Tax=Angustibacter aerolatus TaxID=1162965 RepID=A0ABQ6JG71_9ACTN|nr:hypothetical protein GCM10025868_24450 [Angustibacter aerolatus]
MQVTTVERRSGHQCGSLYGCSALGARSGAAAAPTAVVAGAGPVPAEAGAPGDRATQTAAASTRDVLVRWDRRIWAPSAARPAHLSGSADRQRGVPGRQPSLSSPP